MTLSFFTSLQGRSEKEKCHLFPLHEHGERDAAEHEHGGDRQPQGESLAQQHDASRGREQRRAQLDDGRQRRREARECRVPDGVTDAGGDGSGRGRQQQSLGRPVRGTQRSGRRADDQRRDDGASEVPGVDAERLAGPATAQRVDAPRCSRGDHQQRPNRVRSRQAGARQQDQPTDGHSEPDPLAGPRPRALRDRVADHRDLDGAEEQQGPDAGRDAQVREREGDRVAEQCERRPPRPEQGGCAASARKHAQHQRTAEHADGRERRGIDAPGAQCCSAQQRVGRKRRHGQRREQGRPARRRCSHRNRRIIRGKRRAGEPRPGRVFPPPHPVDVLEFAVFFNASRGSSHVWPFQVAHHQAQEGRGRRQARQDLHAHHQGIDDRGARRRRRSRQQPAPAHGHRRRQGRQHARRQHQARDPAGHGRGAGRPYDEVTYEGYGPGGAAIIIEALTDNRNRTVGEVRHLLTKHGGKLGEPNSVVCMFEQEGLHRRRARRRPTRSN